jgi:recombinational DNA repair ATPase RecF
MGSDPVLAALAGQVDCYRRLSKLAAIQHEHVRQSRTEQLLRVLQARQAVLEQIAAHEQTVAPAKRQWADYAATLAPADRELAERLLAETRALLQQITSADQDDALVLQQRKLSLGREINRATVARQVNRNYVTAAYGKPRPRVDVQQ